MTRISRTHRGRSSYRENPCSRSYFLHYVWFILWVFCRHSLLGWEISFFVQIDECFINVKKLRFCQMLFCLNWNDCVIFMLHSITMVYYIWTNSAFWGYSHSVIFYNLFIHHWILFVVIVLRTFISIFIRDIDL